METLTKLAILRAERGWTQGRLATEAGLSRNTVARLERGEGASLLTLVALAQALEVPRSEAHTLLDPIGSWTRAQDA